LKFELAWIFTNLTTGRTEQLVILKNCGVLNALIKHVKLFKGKQCKNKIVCIDFENEDVLGQTLWALGNFAVDNQQFRIYLI
jgi:hypothetical protein